MGVPKDTFVNLSSRRDEATNSELLRILSDEQHPCQKLISVNKVESKNNLRWNRINKPMFLFLERTDINNLLSHATLY